MPTDAEISEALSLYSGPRRSFDPGDLNALAACLSEDLPGWEIVRIEAWQDGYFHAVLRRAGARGGPEGARHARAAEKGVWAALGAAVALALREEVEVFGRVLTDPCPACGPRGNVRCIRCRGSGVVERN